jgi:ABC-2 type transport system permease protein
MSDIPNIVHIARREYLVRVRTRSFMVGTVFLLLAVAAIAFVPVIVRLAEGSGGAKVGVYVGAKDLTADPVPVLSAVLNSTVTSGTGGATGSGAGIGGGGSTPSKFEVRSVADLDAGRKDAAAGKLQELLAVERPTPGGELKFTLYTNDPTTRTAQLIQQATTAIAVSDRLTRAGVDPATQAGMFVPPSFSLAYPDPARTDTPKNPVEAGTDYLLGFGLTILIFMMVILYGQWVAQSVVEEKSSRVMEVILNAATPFQLLSGKIIGVGALALTQYVLLLVVGVVAMAAQGPVASFVLGANGGSASLPSGLTLPALLILAVFGVLGFALYAVLYAAAGSLVSRQEDLQQAIMPMAMLSTAGYLVAVYSATGLLDPRAGWNAILAQVPFFSPFLMLTRYLTGQSTLPEMLLAVAILIVSVVVAMWLAARVYALGVLLYGQRPGWRSVWRLLREGM